MTLITHEMKNGALKSTQKDLEIARKCYSKAVPFSLLWSNRDDFVKIIEWGDDFENYLEHRTDLISAEGREKYLPWNIYSDLGLKWVDGYAYAQTRGDCCSFGHRNSLKASNLTNAKRAGITPRDTAQSVAYAIARGDGSPNFGDGLNLNPMAAYSAEIGNYWSDDFGAYNGGGYVRNYSRGSEQDQHAKQAQSVIVKLPDTSFETVYKLCRAGFGCNMATGVFPSSARKNSDGLSVADSWSSGGHSMAFVAAWEINGKKYLYLENSHGAIYQGDSLHSGNQFGCWLNESLFGKCGQYGDTYGSWYANIGEIGKKA